MLPVQAVLSTLSPGSSSLNVPLPVAWVERLFVRLSAQFGAKMADLYAGVPPEAVKEEWGAALANLHVSEIQRGLQACQTRAFAPALGEFLRLCRPALDAELAWLEAQEGMKARGRGEAGEWTHPGVQRAAQDFQYELRTSNFHQHRKAWARALDRELRRGWGEDVEPPRSQIPYVRQPRPAPPRYPAPAADDVPSRSSVVPEIDSSVTPTPVIGQAQRPTQRS